MDAGTAAILGSLAGAIVAGPTGYLFERLIARPRLIIQYAQTNYEDVVSFNVETVDNIRRYLAFTHFIESQVKWSFAQRIYGNLFTREELRIIQDLGTHFLGMQKQISERIEKDIVILSSGEDADIERVSTELASDYKESFNSNLSIDLISDQQAAKQKMLTLLTTGKSMMTIGSKWLNEFLSEIDKFIKGRKGSSNRIVVKVGIANHGMMDAVIKTEGKLKSDGMEFKLPIQSARRPWEGEETVGPADFYVLPPRSSTVLSFVLDERLNAIANIEKFRSSLAKKAQAIFDLKGINGETVCSTSFVAFLPTG